MRLLDQTTIIEIGTNRKVPAEALSREPLKYQRPVQLYWLRLFEDATPLTNDKKRIRSRSF